MKYRAANFTGFDYEFLCPACHYIDARVLRRKEERVDYIGRSVRLGENAVAALSLERHALRLEKIHYICGHETRKRAVKKSAVDRHSRDEGVEICAVICDIASALSRYHYFAADFFVAFKQNDFAAVFCCGDGRHKSRRSAAYYKHFRHNLPLFEKITRPRGSDISDTRPIYFRAS